MPGAALNEISTFSLLIQEIHNYTLKCLMLHQSLTTWRPTRMMEEWSGGPDEFVVFQTRNDTSRIRQTKEEHQFSSTGWRSLRELRNRTRPKRAERAYNLPPLHSVCASCHGNPLLVEKLSQGRVLLAVPTVFVQSLCTRQNHYNRALIKVHETSFTDVLCTMMLTDLFPNQLV